MKQRVWKFEIDESVGLNVLPIPASATFLHGAVQQDGKVVAWFLLHPLHDIDGGRMFQIYGTGYDVPDGAVYCFTYARGQLVWHVFEVRQ
jgi:outer membrane protein assembly factor BamB